jgi:hypothetical protein
MTLEKRTLKLMLFFQSGSRSSKKNAAFAAAILGID